MDGRGSASEHHEHVRPETGPDRGEIEIMLGLTIAALLLVLPSTVAAQGSAGPAPSEARSDTEVIEWAAVRNFLKNNSVMIQLPEAYRARMEAYKRQVEVYRARMEALREATTAFREATTAHQSTLVDDRGEDEPPPSPSVSEELPIVSVYMERNTKTSERHGLLGLRWDQREIASVDLLEIDPNLYVVVGVSGSSSLKAPLGNWRVKHEDVPDFYPQYLRPGGPFIQGDIRGDLQ